MTTDIETMLLPDEVRELAQCEGIIQRGLDTFYEVGAALSAINQGKLYRSQFPTFEEYCAVRWGFCRSRAYQLSGAAKTLDNLRMSTKVDILPLSEGQIRQLSALTPEQQVAAWEAAVAHAGGKQPHGVEVRVAINELLHAECGAAELTGTQAKDCQAQLQEPTREGAMTAIHQLEAVQHTIENDGFQPGLDGWANIMGWSCVAGCDIEWNPLQRRYRHHAKCALRQMKLRTLLDTKPL